MRILKLRLRNLNSLVGGWEIDFTHPAFSDGIFAITGPTGAGKTTILDALCLALYGRTPRLNKVTQSVNEIMSRHQGECFAEVEFSVGKEARRCSWSQHRSRKKADGELQQPKREISLLNGEILASSVDEVSAEVKRFTGDMDYSQFTRSMLLAQGDFAAFLKASPNDRATILEQITGPLYSQISSRVHERCKTEKERQRQLQEKADALRLLTAEDEAVLRLELSKLAEEEVRLKDETERLAAALAWLDALAVLRQELAEISKEQAVLAAERQRFADDEARLGRAEQAVQLEGEHAALAALRRQQADDLSAAAALRHGLPELEAALKAADERLVSSGGALAAAKDAQDRGRVLIAAVRELDFRLQEKRAGLAKQEEACSGLRQKNAADLADCGKLEQELARVQAGQQESAAYLTEHAADERLLADLTGLCQRLKQLAELAKRHEAVRLAAAQTEKAAVEAAEFWQSKAEARRSADEQLAEVQAARAAAESGLAQLLQGRKPEELRDEQNALITLTKLLAQADALAKEQADLHEQQTANTAAKRVLAETLHTLRQQRDAARQEEEVRRIEADFAKRVLSLEEQRARLEAGQPCPLCGSPEHPYAQDGGLPLLHQAELTAQAAAAALRQTENALAQAGQEEVRLEQKAQHLAERLAEKDTAAQSLQQQTAGCCAGLDLAPEQAEIERRLAVNRETVQAAEALTDKISLLGKTLEQRKDSCGQAAQAESNAAAARDKTEEARQRLADEERGLADDVATKLRAAQTELTIYYSCAALSLHEIDQTAAALTARRDAWQRQQQQHVAAEQKIAGLHTELKVLYAGIEQRRSQLEQEEPLLQAGRQEAKQLAAERAALFADKQPEAEEQRLANAVKAAEQAVSQAQEEQAGRLKRHDLLVAEIDGKETAVRGRSGLLRTQEEEFARRLLEHAFADEADWQTARLPTEQRTSLCAQADELRRRQAGLELRWQDRADRLAAEEQKQLATTEQPPERLQQEHEALSRRRTETIQNMGAAQQQLAANERQRGLQSELLRQIEAQNRECLRWRDLDELIGSSKGEKYRNFAQGLTFEQMVLHSNRELARIHSRYLLLRDPQQPLELSVADFEQAGEVRSVKNLSGGESFMVSLALALGLSSMVGGKVESLFLDEGFGTLDDDALDSALARLAELRGEGRLIGVISHVAALKERIACQIEAMPGSGGRSLLKGPGVRRL